MRMLIGLALPMLCIAGAEAVSPRQLVEIADIGGPVVSPDGSSVAYRVEQASIERNSHGTTWYVAALERREPPRRVADGGVPMRNSSGVPLAARAVWSPDGHWIYYLALMEGRVEVWRAAADGSSAARIATDPADIREFRLSADGHTLFYSVGATRDEVVQAELAEYGAGIHIDASVPLGQGLFRSGYLDERPATQRLKDNEVMRYPLLAGAADRWVSMDVATGMKRQSAAKDVMLDDRPVRPPGGGESWKSAPEPGGARTAVLARTGEKEGLRVAPGVQLMVLDHKQGKGVMPCTAVMCQGTSITGIQWRPGTSDVVFTVSDPDQGHAQSIFRWDVDADAVHRVIETRGLAGGGRDRYSGCGLSTLALACVVADPETPPKLERIDLVSGDRRVLHAPNEAVAWDMMDVSVRLLRWEDSEGNPFTGQLFMPVAKSPGPLPLVISYYWCLGFVRGGLGDEIPFASLAQKGIAALCINRAPVRTNAVERYELGRSAVESAVDLLTAEGWVDRHRVGMGGLSFGTEATLWTAMRSDVLAAASVSSPMISPQLRLLAGLQGAAFEERLEAYWQLGDEADSSADWRSMSPVFNLDRLRVPVLMQMPEQEYMHVLDYAVPLIRENRADMYVFPNEPHQKFQPRHKLAVYERNIDWFRFWLLDEEDDSPAKSAQYARWRQMRGSSQPTP